MPVSLYIADVLSRLTNQSQEDEPFDESNDKHIFYLLDSTHMSISWAVIQRASEEDSELADVRICLQTGKWPAHSKRFECLAKQLRRLESLIFNDEVVVLPRSLRERVLVHEGHVGIGAMKRILREPLLVTLMALHV